jgi:hypothetical protein
MDHNPSLDLEAWDLALTLLTIRDTFKRTLYIDYRAIQQSIMHCSVLMLLLQALLSTLEATIFLLLIHIMVE